MSLLADLLSRAKRSGKSPKDVPPQLRQILEDQRAGRNTKRRLILFGTLIAVVVGIGGATVYYLQPPTYQSPIHNRPTTGSVPADSSRPETVQPSATVATEPAQPVPASAPTVSPVAQAPAVSSMKKEAAITETIVKPAKPQTAAPRVSASAGEVARNRASARPSAPASSLRTPSTQAVPTADKSDERAYHLYLGRQAEQDGDLPVAIEHYRAASALPPPDADILNNLASLSLRMNRPEQALAHAEAALALRPDLPSALVNSAIAAARLGDRAKAEERFLAAVRVTPSDSKAIMNLGLFYEREGRWDDAIRQYRACADLGNAEAYADIGRVLELAGRRDEAIGHYRTTLESDALPSSARAGLSARLRVLTSDRSHP